MASCISHRVPYRDLQAFNRQPSGELKDAELVDLNPWGLHRVVKGDIWQCLVNIARITIADSKKSPKPKAKR